MKVLPVDVVGLLPLRIDRGNGRGVVDPDVGQADPDAILCELKVAGHNRVGQARGDRNLVREAARLGEKPREPTARYDLWLLTCRRGAIVVRKICLPNNMFLI